MPKHTTFIAPNVRYDYGGNVIIEERFGEEARDGLPPEGRDRRSRPMWLAVPDIDCRLLLRGARSGARFSGTFLAIFAGLFVLFNAPSYVKIAKASLFPFVDQEEKQVLWAMVDPKKYEQFLAVPELPRAGVDIGALLPKPAVVAPPDSRLIIPKLNVNVPIVEVSDAALRRGDIKTFNQDIQHALTFGVLRYPGTAYPGEIGNVFLTGHSSNLPWVRSKYNAVFALLPQLEIGDEYAIYDQGKGHRYRVTEKFEVSPNDVSVLDQPRDRRMSTLMTCTPVGTTLRRLIIRGEEVAPEDDLLLRQDVVQRRPLQQGQQLPI